jgi:hypothetical protein
MMFSRKPNVESSIWTRRIGEETTLRVRLKRLLYHSIHWIFDSEVTPRRTNYGLWKKNTKKERADAASVDVNLTIPQDSKTAQCNQ